MLTQEDFVGPNMSGQAHLRRSSWKAEAIRRGDLKISGPIPITEDTPLNEEEEREYAEKYRMNAASPLRDDAAQPSQRPQTPPPPVPLSIPNEPVPATPSHGDAQPQKQEELHDSPPPRSSPGTARTTVLMSRGSIAEPVPHSTPSPFPSIPESNGKSGPKRKRKSGLRNVFRKMFGKKGRDEPQDEEPEPVRRGHSYHMSEPGLTTRHTPEKKDSPTSQRISDIQVEAPHPINPLGQHLPFPMNVNAPQEASPPHEYLTFDAPRQDLGRRRATLPTLHVTGGETQSWNGSRERLQPWDERHENESQIGIALSSPPHVVLQSIQSKRRSRSAGALRDLAKGRPSIERRRSAEIRYWRDSHASGSIYSSNTRPQTARTVDTVRTTGTNDTTTKAPESIVEITPAITQPVVVQRSQEEHSELPLPVEAFNFGDLKSGFSDDEDSEEPAAASQAQKRLSIEDRVLNLEANVRTLETSVRRMSGRNNRQTIILENPPKGRRSSRNRSSSAASERLSLRSSGSNVALQAQEAMGAPRSPILAPLSAVNESGDRPKAEVVLEQQEQRPATAIPRSDNNPEHFAAVHDALKCERSARKALEKQVSALQRELADLQALVNKLIINYNNNSNSMYPTPSPDTLITSNEERVSTPRASRPEPAHIDIINASRYNRPDSELGYGPESVTSSKEDITSPEAFMTPKEEIGFGSESDFFRHEK